MFQKIRLFKTKHVIIMGIAAVVIMFAIYKKKNVEIQISNYFIFKVTN